MNIEDLDLDISFYSNGIEVIWTNPDKKYSTVRLFNSGYIWYNNIGEEITITRNNLIQSIQWGSGKKEITGIYRALDDSVIRFTCVREGKLIFDIDLDKQPAFIEDYDELFANIK